MKLTEPWLLLSLLLLVPILWSYFGRKKRRPALQFPSLAVARLLTSSPLTRLRHVPIILRCLALALLALALARPQAAHQRSQKTTEGLDIVLIVDTSRSMEARDFVIDGERPTRLAVVKKVIGDFIGARGDDRIGMVIFGSEAFTQAPLTLDHGILLRFLERVAIGMAGDATAIGDGLATAVNRLKDVEAKSRVAILLTDGENTAGRVDPMAATEAAKAFGVKVYTIGVGSDGQVPVVVNGRVRAQKAEIDEESLQKIAETTGGKYFRATDTETLRKVYDTIDTLEKSKQRVDSFEKREERFAGLVGAALFCVLAELGFALTRFRSIP